MNMVAQGTDLKGINSAVLEYFSPGDKLELLVGLPRQLSDGEFQQVANSFASSGIALDAVESGSVQEWNAPEVLRFRFQRPSMASGQGYAFLPVILGIGLLGLAGIFTWKMSKIPESFAKNLVPITMILTLGIGGAWVLSSYFKSKQTAR